MIGFPNYTTKPVDPNGYWDMSWYSLLQGLWTQNNSTTAVTAVSVDTQVNTNRVQQAISELRNLKARLKSLEAVIKRSEVDTFKIAQSNNAGMFYPTFASGPQGRFGYSTGLSFQPSTGTLKAKKFQPLASGYLASTGAVGQTVALNLGTSLSVTTALVSGTTCVTSVSLVITNYNFTDGLKTP